MIDDNKMDTTNVPIDREEFSKEDLLSTGKDDKENIKVSNFYIQLLGCTSVLHVYLYTIVVFHMQKHLVDLFEEPDLSDYSCDVTMDLPQLESSPCSDHEAVLSVGMSNNIMLVW